MNWKLEINRQNLKDIQCFLFANNTMHARITALYMYLLIHDLLNLQWFDDVGDELSMYVSITDLFVEEHANCVLGGETTKIQF